MSEIAQLRRDFARRMEAHPVPMWRAALLRVVNAAIDSQFHHDGSTASDADRAAVSGNPITGENMAELAYERAEFVRRVESTPRSMFPVGLVPATTHRRPEHRE